MNINKQKKDERLGWAISLGIHAALLLFFFFIMAWREPNPPHPEYGIELNLGLEEAGFGNYQPTVPVRPQPTPDPVREEVRESAAERVQPNPEPVQPTTPQQTSPAETQAPVVQDAPSEVTAKPETRPRTETQPKKTEPVQEPKPQPPKEATSEEKKENVTQPNRGRDAYPQPGATPSQGDTKGATSDQGSKTGSVDARALYGQQGGGDGPSLDIAGWMWNSIPRPNDSSTEAGRIVYEITLDDRGDVIGVRTLESTVSPGVERLYREAVQKLTFSPTSDNRRPAPRTTGKITFIIKSR
ncbi:MAG: TonB family protein [Cyclobacteriaceae bacterium]|nr:TonB family protein [Cyclobacteriaceae bacterium]